MEQKEKNYRTYQIWIRSDHRLYPYMKQICINAKNLYNTTNFYIRQVYTALTQEKPLQPLQQEVLDTIEQHFDQMNITQMLAYGRAVNRESKKPLEKRNEVKCNLFEKPNHRNPFLSYRFLDSLFKCMSQTDYRSLSAHGSQAVMQGVFQNWKSFFASLKEYKKNPDKFNGKPKIPKYMKTSQKEITLSNQECKVKEDKYLKLPLTKTLLNIGKLGVCGYLLKQVRIIPSYGQFVLELVIEVPSQVQEIKEASKDRCLSIDLGIDNLATIVTNTGIKPVVVKGRKVKAINQYYNKRKAYLNSVLRHGKKQKEDPFTSNRLERLHQKRHLKIKDFFHKASHYIVQFALQEKIGTIVIGKNKEWKQSVDIGKQNNQSFCSIPHSLFIEMIRYKAKEHGIQVVLQEESFTSKASFLDGDSIPVYGTEEKPAFSGKRINRGMYRSKKGVFLNADVNGACNILRKCIPNAFGHVDTNLLTTTPIIVDIQ